MVIQILSMVWGVALAASLALLACFPRFLLRPLPTSLASSNAGQRRKRVLLLVAHPDDECMFFGPTLLSMMKQAAFEIQVLCISIGNADGLGECRRLEMLASCRVLQVPKERVEVLDDPALQDGHEQRWHQPLLVNIIKQNVEVQKMDLVITFDKYGVSGHPNHSALSRALRTYLLQRKLLSCQNHSEAPLETEGWELVSWNIARKYSGVMEVSLSSLGWLLRKRKADIHCFVTPNPQISIAAMREHKSQWVWYRKLFVLFGAYTYVNTLRKITLDADAPWKDGK